MLCVGLFTALPRSLAWALDGYEHRNMSRTQRRVAALAAISVVLMATSCLTDTGIAIALPPGANVDSAAVVAFAAVASVAQRRSLELSSPLGTGDVGWRQCFADPTTKDAMFRITALCGKVYDGEAQFWLSQRGKGFTAHTDSLRRELLDTLRSRFGEHSVRECKWEWRGTKDHRASGCKTV